MASRAKTQTVRMRADNYGAVQKLAQTQVRNIVDQMSLVVQLGLGSTDGRSFERGRAPTKTIRMKTSDYIAIRDEAKEHGVDIVDRIDLVITRGLAAIVAPA